MTFLKVVVKQGAQFPHFEIQSFKLDKAVSIWHLDRW